MSEDRSIVTMADRVRDFGITLTARRIDRNPQMEDMPRGSFHWSCTLKCQGRRITIQFSQGPAITKDPTAEDILNCLALDASGLENARDFEDWCGEYGYDTDSRKAEKTYKAVERQTAKLHKLIDPLGDCAWNNLLFHTEAL